MHQVDVNGVIHEFPDEATPEMIEAALASESKPNAKKSLSLQDIFSEAFGNAINPTNLYPLNVAKQVSKTAPVLAEDILGAGKALGKGVQEGAGGAIAQKTFHPLEALKNELGGLAGAGRALVNLPHDLPTYLAHLKMVDPELAKKVSDHIWEVPELESTINQMIGRDPNAADKYLRKLFETVPMGLSGAKPAGKLAPVIGNEIANIAKQTPEFLENLPGAIGEQIIGKEPIKEADVLAKENEIAGKIGEHEALETEAMQKKEAHRQTVAEAEKNLNMANANRMEYRLSEQNKKIQDLRQESDRLQTDLKQLPELPEKPVAGEEHIEKVKLAEEGVNKLKQNVIKAENHYGEVEKTANQSEADLGKYLDMGASHDVRAARIAKGKLEANREELSSEYDTIKSDLENENVVIDNTHKVKELTADFNKLIAESGGDINTTEIKAAADKLISAKNREIIPAGDFVSMYKSVNGYMREAYRKAYKIGRTEDEHITWKKRGDEASEKLKEMDSILEKNLPKEVYDRLKKTPARWRNEIIPLYKEPLYWQIMENERLPKDMLSALRGGKKGSGLEIINRHIMSDPQAVKHVIGQRYDVNPKSVHNPNEEMKRFISLDPHVAKLVDIRNQAHGMMENAKGQIKDIKKRHVEAKAELPSVRKESIARQSEINKQLKEYERLTGERIKNKEELEAKIREHESEITALHEHNELLKKHIAEVRESFNNTNITLKQKHKLGMEIKQLKRELKTNQIKEFTSTTRLKKLYKFGRNVYRIIKTVKRGGL